MNEFDEMKKIIMQEADLSEVVNDSGRNKNRAVEEQQPRAGGRG